MVKSTPKSCSCGVCRTHRGSDAQHRRERQEERAFRHRQNELVRHLAIRGLDREGIGLGVVPAGVRGRAA